MGNYGERADNRAARATRAAVRLCDEAGRKRNGRRLRHGTHTLAHKSITIRFIPSIFTITSNCTL